MENGKKQPKMALKAQKPPAGTPSKIGDPQPLITKRPRNASPSPWHYRDPPLSLDIGAWTFFRHSRFVIRHYFSTQPFHSNFPIGRAQALQNLQDVKEPNPDPARPQS